MVGRMPTAGAPKWVSNEEIMVAPYGDHHERSPDGNIIEFIIRCSVCSDRRKTVSGASYVLVSKLHCARPLQAEGTQGVPDAKTAS